MASTINASTSAGVQTTADTSGILQIQSNGVTQLTVDSTGTYGQLKQGTAQNSTSGTSIDFTGIPSWVKRITVMFGGVSTSGASNLILRVGAGSIQTSSYQSGASSSPSAGYYSTNTSGFILVPPSGQASTSLFYGTLTITSMGGNNWTEAGNIYDTSYYTVCNSSGGAVALSGTLDRIRITTVNGTDTFDAGSINILYEG